jgi:hypothetical protein
MIETTPSPVHVKSIWATHCDDGGVIVLFWAKTDVPLLHEGYIYKDRDYKERTDCNKLLDYPREVFWSHSFFPYTRHITGNWYRVSNQPGF